MTMRPKTVKVENKGPTYQDPTRTITTIFGGRAVSKDKQE